MGDKLREALEAARELASGWQYAGKQWDEAQEVVRLVDEALAADDAARGTMPAAYETVESSIVGRYRVVKRNGGGFWPYCVQAGDGTMELFIGHKTQCEKVAAALQTACLDGAFMASLAATRAAAPQLRCPTCDSPAPHQHPAVQHEGEVQICSDAWHLSTERGRAALKAAAPQSAERVCRDDGRCQYAIDHGAEGLGHCPKGKCAMPTAPTDAEWLEEAMRRYHDLDERGLRTHLSTRPAQAAASEDERKDAGWQPIETAPKDGTRVLCVWACAWGEMVYEGWCQGVGTARDGGDFWRSHSLVPVSGRPTHWMPLPPPPIDAAMSAQAGGKEQGS